MLHYREYLTHYLYNGCYHISQRCTRRISPAGQAKELGSQRTRCCPGILHHLRYCSWRAVHIPLPQDATPQSCCWHSLDPSSRVLLRLLAAAMFIATFTDTRTQHAHTCTNFPPDWGTINTRYTLSFSVLMIRDRRYSFMLLNNTTVDGLCFCRYRRGCWTMRKTGVAAEEACRIKRVSQGNRADVLLTSLLLLLMLMPFSMMRFPGLFLVSRLGGGAGKIRGPRARDVRFILHQLLSFSRFSLAFLNILAMQSFV